MTPTKRAERVLKNYRNFLKLGKLSEKPFSTHALELVEEIENTIDKLDGLSGLILKNLYLTSSSNRKSRAEICKEYGIAVKDYNQTRERAVENFARLYRDGALRKKDKRGGYSPPLFPFSWLI